MRRITFILIFLISFILLSSLASAQFKVPLDILSNFFNSILRSLGITATATQQKTIPSSGTIVYSCDSRCKARPEGFTSGTCEVGSTTNSKNLAVQPFSADAFNSGHWSSAIGSPLNNFIFLDSSVTHYLTPSARIEPNDVGGGDVARYGLATIVAVISMHCIGCGLKSSLVDNILRKMNLQT